MPIYFHFKGLITHGERVNTATARASKISNSKVKKISKFHILSRKYTVKLYLLTLYAHLIRHLHLSLCEIETSEEKYFYARLLTTDSPETASSRKIGVTRPTVPKY